MLILALGSHPATATGLADHHRLTLSELNVLADEFPDSVSLKLALARKTGQSDQAAALQLVSELSDLSLDPSERLIVTGYACELNIKQGLSSVAAPFCEQITQSLEQANLSPVSRALALNAQGYYFIRQGKPEDALARFEAALRNPEMNDQVIAVTIMHNRGVSLMLSGLTDLAVKAFESADQNKSVLAVDEALPTILAYNLGYVQAQAGNHEGALRSYAIVIPWLESTGQLVRAYIAHTQISLSLSGTGQYARALQELTPWMDRTDLSVSPDSAAQAQLALGKAYLGLERVDEAKANLLKGIQIATESDNPSRLRELSMAYGELLLEYQDSVQAIRYLTSFLDRFSVDNKSLELGPAHRLLARAYAKNNQFEDALNHSLMAADAVNAAQGEDFLRRLASLSISNELDVKDQQLYVAEERQKALEAQRRLTQMTQAGAFGAIAVLFILVLFYFNQRSRVRESKVSKVVAERLQKEVEIRTQEVQQALRQSYEAEQQRAEMELRLAKDEKLRLIGQLTGGVAHDFNNLLTVIQLSSELLQIDLPENQQKLAKDIITASNSGKAITSGLLAYARQQVLQPTFIDLKAFFTANNSIFRRALHGLVQLETVISDQDLPLLIRADAGQLVSAVLNLILNAREASKAGSSIRVSVRREAGKVAIVICDFGLGMSPEEVKHAVEPFYTTKGPAEGSGLGLAMVDGFMNQSGGELRVESEPGAGTTVTLLFELAAPEAPFDSPTAGLAAAGAGQSILLVEDDPQIRDVVKMALESSGYKVSLAENGDEALAKMESTTQFDLLISDLMMPGTLSGEQLIEAVRILIPALPVLLMTGYAAYVPDQHPILIKPFKLKDLLATVAQLLKASDIQSVQV
ncbi:MAG: signal transduction histidine kinase/Tfp pilus assembly protein PilF [Candidatus Azotimanducaceae bacterium]